MRPPSSSASRSAWLPVLAMLTVAAGIGAAGALYVRSEPSRLLQQLESLLVGSSVGAIALWWRHRSALRERARHEDERRNLTLTRHLELLSEHAEDVVLLVDGNGVIARANDRTRELYGRPPEAFVGLHLRSLRAPGSADDIAEHLRCIRRDGRQRYETAHLRTDGTEFPVEVSARGLEVDGEWYFQAIVRDATERRRVLAELSYQAELLRNVYDGVIGLDAGHVIRSWNAGAERMYGLAPQQVIGRPIKEVLPSEYAGFDSWGDFVEKVDRLDRMQFQVRRRFADGRVVDVEAAAVVLRDAAGSITGYVTVNRDVTVRNRAQAALRVSQERLARILETSNEAIWIVDAEGRTEYVNARAAQFFGAAQDEMLGRPILDFIPETGPAMALADMESLQRGSSVRREFSRREPDGSETWVHLSRSALRDSEGRVTGAVGVFMDVTEQRRARDQLLHAQKMDAVGRLASGIAHDFNNLLVSILSCSGFLVEALPDGDPRRRDAEDIRDAGTRAAHLVRQLLAFARKSSFQPTTTSLNEVVDGIEKILRRTLGSHIAIAVARAADAWPIHVDRTQLELVLVNLAVNARDAMPDGGELRIETRNVELERPPASCDALPPGRYAVVTVSDTGCGIDAEILPRIFEPFFTTKPEGEGTGLGLSTVQGIVADAGGRIEVTSAAGRGTTFTVYMPVRAGGARDEPVGAAAVSRIGEETALG